jgi:hypothetical protein
MEKIAAHCHVMGNGTEVFHRRKKQPSGGRNSVKNNRLHTCCTYGPCVQDACNPPARCVNVCDSNCTSVKPTQ